MAFCNKCGANLEPGVRFCNKCGAAILASTLPPAASSATMSSTPSAPPAAPAPTSQGGGALKVILIVAAVIVAVVVLGVGTLGFIAWHIAKNSHVRQEGDRVRVETPFGTVESSKDPEAAARSLGVDIYPGAQVLKDGATSTSIGGVHTAAVNFESSDSVDKVSAFYKAKFPNAMVTTSDEHHCTIVSNDRKNMITINIEEAGDGTKIQITSITHNSDTKPSAN